MFFLAPSVARLLEAAANFSAGEGSGEAVQEALGPGREFCAESRELYQQLAGGILRTDEVDELLRQCGLELDAQARYLDELERTVREDKAVSAGETTGRLQGSFHRLAELYSQIQEAETQEKIYSPFPPLDHFIKAGINHLNNYLEVDQLKQRLDQVVGPVADLEGRVYRFEILYGDEQKTAQARQALTALQAGLGAVAQYLDTNQRPALEDGLRLLGSSSTVLFGQLAEFDKQVVTQHSRYRYLDEFLRALELYHQNPEKIPLGLVYATWNGVGQVVAFYQRQLEGVLRLSLFPELREQWEAAEKAWRELGEIYNQVNAALDPLPTLEQVPKQPLEHAFEVLVTGVDILFQRLEQEVTRFRHAPHLEGLRELVGRAQKGELPDGQLRQALEDYQTRQAELGQQLSRQPHDPVNQEMMALLGVHGAAFAEMQLYFEDQDRGHFAAGWKMMEGTLERLLELGQEVERRVAPRGRGPKTVTCFRCSAANPTDRRLCQACGAVLPVVPTGPEATLDITGMGVTGAAENALEEVLSAAEGGTITRHELRERIDDLLERAGVARQGFEKKLIPLMGQSAELDAYLRFFAQSIGAYVQGLIQVRGFAEGQNVSHLMSGGSQAREAAENMELMKQKIDEALTG